MVSQTGDGVLAQFLGADDAAGCAFEIQGGIADFNREYNQLFFPFQLRCGISCGEISEEAVTGRHASLIIDSAVKAQENSPPGGICVTWEAHHDLKAYRDYFSYDRYSELLKTELYVNRPVPHWNAFTMGVAAASYNRGFDLLEAGDYPAAEVELRNALMDAEAAGDLIHISTCLHGLAYALGRQRKNHEKTGFCLRQIRIERKLGRAKELQTAYRNIFYAYFWLARDLEREQKFDDALKFYGKTARVSRKLDDDRLSKEAARNLNDLEHYLSLRK